MTSPSIRPTSVMWVMRRRPSTSRLTWMIRSNALAIWSRMALSGRSKPAVRTRVSVRARASRGLFAWIVVSEPSWPVFHRLEHVDGRALDRDDALPLGDERGEDVQERRLARAGTARDQHVQLALDARLQEGGRL